MANQVTTVEGRIARIASRQKGIVAFPELLAAEISRAEIHHRAEIGFLIRMYRGVYRVGHQAPSTEASYLAAVKAAGEGAVLAGLAAAHLYGLDRGEPPPPEVATPARRRIEGLRARHRRMHPLDRSSFRGIPILPVPAVLVDVAPLLDDGALARACHEAGVRYRTTPAHVQAVLDRRPNAPGAGRLRRVMTGEAPVSLSRLESGFLEVLRAAGLPLPVTNRLVATKRVDCRWPERRLTVELDSFRFHNSRHAWEQDLRREREAHARRDAFRRYTWADVFEDSTHMLRELTELLS